MWTYQDQTTFAPKIRKDDGPKSEFRAGWKAALAVLRDEANAHEDLRQALVALLERLFVNPRFPGGPSLDGAYA